MKSTEERLRSYEPLWENWRYTGELLGEGGMSSVFEICSDAFGTKEFSALKIITVKDMAGGKVNIPKNALNEINILRSLSDCRNIVHYSDSTIREIHDDTGAVCGADIMVRMEKLKVLSEGSRLTEKEIIKLATDMCHALISASKKGIIHRDIKPQNIFVDNEGTFKLGDFGVAKIVSDASMHFTKDIGTLAYAAPEICSERADSFYDASTDIYSLGLVLYTFLNDGYLPFVDPVTSMREAIMKRIRGGVFSSPKNGSKNIQRIVMRACEFDAKRRYRTAQEMLEDLEMLSDDGKKKYIIDPFATLDASLDGDTIEYIASSVAPSTSFDVKEPPKKKGIISSIPPAPKSMPEPAKPKSTAPRMIISTPAKIDATPKREVKKPTEKAPSATGSRFIGSLNSTAPKTDATPSLAKTPSAKVPVTPPVTSKAPSAEKPKDKEPEKKSSSYFFKTPEL